MSGYLEAFVQLFQRKSPGVPGNLSLTEWEGLRTTQQELPNQEETRAGYRFWLGTKNGATGIAPAQAIPTTAAQWVIWNKDTLRSIILDELGAFLVSGTAGSGITIVATKFSTPSQDAVTASAAIGIVSGNGDGTALTSSCAIVKESVTISQPAAPIWFPIAFGTTLATAVASVTADGRLTPLAGKIIIPPKTGLGLAVLSPAGTTPLYVPVGSWIEKIVTNE